MFLGIATLYSLHLPLRQTLTLVDAAVLVSIFAATRAVGQGAGQEPDLVGTSAWVGGL